MTPSSIIWLVILGIGALLFYFYAKLDSFLRCILFTAISGLCTLGILWIASIYIAVPLSVTPLTLAVSGILGIPGVIAMLILKLI